VANGLDALILILEGYKAMGLMKEVKCIFVNTRHRTFM